MLTLLAVACSLLQNPVASPEPQAVPAASAPDAPTVPGGAVAPVPGAAAAAATDPAGVPAPGVPPDAAGAAGPEGAAVPGAEADGADAPPAGTSLLKPVDDARKHAAASTAGAEAGEGSGVELMEPVLAGPVGKQADAVILVWETTDFTGSDNGGCFLALVPSGAARPIWLKGDRCVRKLWITQADADPEPELAVLVPADDNPMATDLILYDEGESGWTVMKSKMAKIAAGDDEPEVALPAL